jgi:hypothetical protein
MSFFELLSKIAPFGFILGSIRLISMVAIVLYANYSGKLLRNIKGEFISKEEDPAIFEIELHKETHGWFGTFALTLICYTVSGFHVGIIENVLDLFR